MCASHPTATWFFFLLEEQKSAFFLNRIYTWNIWVFLQIMEFNNFSFDCHQLHSIIQSKKRRSYFGKYFFSWYWFEFMWLFKKNEGNLGCRNARVYVFNIVRDTDVLETVGVTGSECSCELLLRALLLHFRFIIYTSIWLWYILSRKMLRRAPYYKFLRYIRRKFFWEKPIDPRFYAPEPATFWNVNIEKRCRKYWLWGSTTSKT